MGRDEERTGSSDQELEEGRESGNVPTPDDRLNGSTTGTIGGGGPMGRGTTGAPVGESDEMITNQARTPRPEPDPEEEEEEEPPRKR
jgi:hypothetical protein